MPVELVHPERVNRVGVHHQVAVAQGSRIVYMAGQVSWDVDGVLVGEGDLEAQTEQCYLNVAAALEGAGATLADVAHITAYVVGLDPARTAQVLAGRARAAAALGVDLQQPGTFVGVMSLFDPNYLIEVEATAVLGTSRRGSRTSDGSG